MARQSSNGPVRSCVGCGARRAKQELVRFANKEGTLLPDISSLINGRGAYLCYNKKCFFKALKKNAFSRAFKTQIGLVGLDVSHADAKPIKEAAYEDLWQIVSDKLSKTGKIKEVKLKG
ncbi:COG2740: Predicted nucleic-acid-binding protein implicated in transcription termination [hydrothermal vent metagenome]|uniref:COG2740: Predicted nucleic-acid-binding protein implicated in transcription termination n=1 Tax=hydrothermal vent metagenome TaxID=652676 RepID=A0A3B0R040_9ZZZZ